MLILAAVHGLHPRGIPSRHRWRQRHHDGPQGMPSSLVSLGLMGFSTARGAPPSRAASRGPSARSCERQASSIIAIVGLVALALRCAQVRPCATGRARHAEPRVGCVAPQPSVPDGAPEVRPLPAAGRWWALPRVSVSLGAGAPTCEVVDGVATDAARRRW